jgi:CRP/FNR family transcriptional regulator
MPSRTHDKKLNPECARCAAQTLCLNVALQEDELITLDEFIEDSRIIEKGDILFQKDDLFKGIYVVRSGSFKLIQETSDGKERILGFYLPGDLMGFDAARHEIHEFTAIALEKSAYCKLSLEALFKVASQSSPLQRQLFLMMSREISHHTEILLNTSAEERVAKFLLSLSEKARDRKLASDTFHLSMSREEIGNYLGLATETVIRIFNDFQKQGVLQIQLREIQVLNFKKLKTLEKS